MKLIPGIQIRIDKASSLRVREWVHETDWQIIANQIEMRGASICLDRQHGERFCRITEVPKKRGRYRPHYGDFEGGFEYLFRSRPEGTKLLARSTVLKVYRKSLEPFEIVLPNMIEIQTSAN